VRNGLQYLRAFFREQETWLQSRALYRLRQLRCFMHKKSHQDEGKHFVQAALRELRQTYFKYASAGVANRRHNKIEEIFFKRLIS
jgi:hypothetical protein